ncbi:hypothetical protein ANCDUO_25708, partial [Ancylostoma duodenale]
YVYVKSLQNRDKLYDDVKNYTNLMVQSFQDIIKHQHWMTPETRKNALERVDKIQKNLGWPHKLFGNFEDPTAIDAYHRTGLKNREEIRRLSEKPDRFNKSWNTAQLSFDGKKTKRLSLEGDSSIRQQESK